MSTDAHVLAERQVPRYTSYPTAPHFSAEVGPLAYAAWLAQIPPSVPLSLYFHVPFCRDLCLYCGCHTKAIRKRDPLDGYIERLQEEIVLVADCLRARKISHLHWGGGTPSILGGDGLSEVVSSLAARFDLSGLSEHAIELDPRHVGRPLAHALAGIGVNRASLGVQDFSPQVQEAIGRVQPYEVVARTVETLRDAGISNLNFDLMYGLPRQRIEDVRRSALLAVSLHPKRVALFGYAHVPWFRTQQRLIDTASLAGPAERLAQMEAARETFLSAGYVEIGFDHFALPGDELAVAARSARLHRNFQGYTADTADALIGLGASAIGRLPQGFVQNAPDIGGYGRAISARRLATVKGVALSLEDRVRGRIIEKLMCELEADPVAIAEQSGLAEPFAEEFQRLAPLAAEGIVSTSGNRIVVTETGRPLVRLVAAAFDSYLGSGGKRHSIAV
jgi:oxygen-independent coproporphyrinogen-3 oxidase